MVKYHFASNYMLNSRKITRFRLSIQSRTRLGRSGVPDSISPKYLKSVGTESVGSRIQVPNQLSQYRATLSVFPNTLFLTPYR